MEMEDDDNASGFFAMSMPKKQEVEFEATGSDEEMYDAGKSDKDTELLDDELSKSGLVSCLQDKFRDARDKRFTDEQRWVTCYQNYRGIQPQEEGEDELGSKVVVKVTKTKIIAAYNQVSEVLFGNGRFPITVDPTTLPEGVADQAHINMDPQVANNPTVADAFDQSVKPRYILRSSGRELSYEQAQDVERKFGNLSDFVDVLPGEIKEGPGVAPKSVTFEPALIAAKKMEKKIMDQLEEADAPKHLRYVAFEMCLFGTGIMKGPFVINKEYPKWKFSDGKSSYEPVIMTRPALESVSIWNFYPDPDADTPEELEFVFQRHKLSRTQLINLKKRPFFRKSVIDDLIDQGPNYIREWWEDQLDDDSARKEYDRWDVLEFWGFMDPELLREYGVDVPDTIEDNEYVSCNIWFSGDAVIRCVLNPFKPQRIPYYAAPYELNPYSFFGIGVAENMTDTQTLMNGFMRLAVDNAALSGNLIFEIDAQNLAPGTDLSVYPGKVFERQAGAPGQAIFATQFPNVSEQNMMMFDVARKLSDESTGIPSFAHGETGVQDTGRTASGISMLMEAANGTIRSVIKNLDDYLLGPLGKAFFAWNMQYDPDESIQGDLDVNARGTESLMANAVRSQRLMQFLGIVQNPITAPFAKMDYLLREIARSLDLDPDKVANNMQDAAIAAALLQKMNPSQTPMGGNGAQTADGQMVQTAPPGQAIPEKAPPGVEGGNTRGTGGGASGTPAPMPPGDAQFSARKG